MKVGPGQTVPSKPLTSVILQPFLQFTQNIGICNRGQISQQLLLVRSAGVLESSVNSILDGIDDLIHPGEEPADGHGLEVALALVLEARHLSPGVGWLQLSPGLGINPWLGQSVVCPRKSTVSQQKSGGLSLHPEVKVSELDVCHLDGAEEMNLS